MIDKNKRFQKEQAKAKTRKRIHVEIDPDNYDYIPEVKQTSYYDNDVKSHSEVQACSVLSIFQIRPSCQ